MPKYCPSCAEEYRDDIRRCADCNVDLVGERVQRRPAAPAVIEEAEPDDRAEVVFHASTLDVAELLARHLVEARCPATVREDPDSDQAPFVVTLPERYRAAALHVVGGLGETFEIVAGEDDTPIFIEKAVTLPPDAFPILREKSPRDVEALADVLARGNPEAVARVTELYRALGARGVEALVDVIAANASEPPVATSVYAFEVARALRPAKLPTTLAARVRGAAPLVRRDLLRLPGIVDDRDQIPICLEGLADPEEIVRAEAIDSLWMMCGTSYGFAADAPTADRDKAIARWRDLHARGTLPTRERKPASRPAALP